MYKVAKIMAIGITAMIFLIGCNDKSNTTAFDEILKQQLFAPLTDSIKHEPKRDDLYFRRSA
jgi:hypothetical protein